MAGLLGRVLAGLITVRNLIVLTFGKKKSTINLDMLEGGWVMWSEVVSIEEIGEMDMIDIEVSGNHLFYANDILTHNSSSDVGLEDTSESFGLPATADFMFALISTEELQQINQIMVKQLKNRYSDLGNARRFVVGVDRSKMRLYNVEQSAQQDILDGPVMDNTEFGEQDFERSQPKSKFDRSKLQNFK
jgi:hypothetical protein